VAYLIMRFIVWVFQRIAIAKMKKQLYGKKIFPKVAASFSFNNFTVIRAVHGAFASKLCSLLASLCSRGFQSDYCLYTFRNPRLFRNHCHNMPCAYLLIQLYVWVFERIAMSPAHKRKLRYLNYTLYTIASAFLLYVYFYHYPTL